MTHTKGRVWACWSHSQQAVHIEDEAEGLEINREAYARNKPMDHIVLGVFSSREDASKFLDAPTEYKGGSK